MSRFKTIPPPPPGLVLSRVPTQKGKRAAWEWITNTMGVQVTMNFVVTNANSGKIRRTRIGNAIYFSTQDLYDFVMSYVVDQDSQAS